MFCSSCGKQFDPTVRFCAACGAPAPTVPPPAAAAFHATGQLVRPRSPRMIAGVCSGFALHYGWDLNLVRLLTVAITLLTGVTFFVYIAAWIIIPDGQYALPTPPPPPPAPMTPPVTTQSAAI